MMLKKPKGLGKFSGLLRKLVKVQPSEVTPSQRKEPEPLRCPKCGSTALDWGVYNITCNACGHGWRFGFS
jgi:ribosomal protein L37AE/L43A